MNEQQKYDAVYDGISGFNLQSLRGSMVIVCESKYGGKVYGGELIDLVDMENNLRAARVRRDGVDRLVTGYVLPWHKELYLFLTGLSFKERNSLLGSIQRLWRMMDKFENKLARPGD